MRVETIRLYYYLDTRFYLLVLTTKFRTFVRYFCVATIDDDRLMQERDERRTCKGVSLISMCLYVSQVQRGPCNPSSFVISQ